MQRSFFLHNGFSPSGELSSHIFQVSEGMVVLAASGILAGEFIPIDVRVEAVLDRGLRNPGMDMAYYWAPLYIGGCQVRLAADNTQLALTVPGTYRINIGGVTNPAGIVVALNEDEKMKYGNVIFGYNTNSGCANQTCGGSTVDPVVCPPATVQGVTTTWG